MTLMLCTFCPPTIRATSLGSVEIARNHRRTKRTEHESRRSDPRKDSNSTFLWQRARGLKKIDRGLRGCKFRAIDRGLISDISSRPWRNFPPTSVIHMATRRPAHNTPIHMDLVPFERKPYKKSMWIGVLWAGLAGRHVDHPCGWQISPWPARNVTELTYFRETGKSCFSYRAVVEAIFEAPNCL